MRVTLSSADKSLHMSAWIEGSPMDPIVRMRAGESIEVRKGELLRAVLALCTPDELRHYAGVGAYLDGHSAAHETS